MRKGCLKKVNILLAKTNLYQGPINDVQRSKDGDHPFFFLFYVGLGLDQRYCCYHRNRPGANYYDCQQYYLGTRRRGYIVQVTLECFRRVSNPSCLVVSY
jgi:hypothetical protein